MPARVAASIPPRVAAAESTTCSTARPRVGSQTLTSGSGTDPLTRSVTLTNGSDAAHPNGSPAVAGGSGTDLGTGSTALTGGAGADPWSGSTAPTADPPTGVRLDQVGTVPRSRRNARPPARSRRRTGVGPQRAQAAARWTATVVVPAPPWTPRVAMTRPAWAAVAPGWPGRPGAEPGWPVMATLASSAGRSATPSGQASRLRAPAARAALTSAARSSSPMATIGVRQSAGRLASAAQPTRATDGPVARAAVRPAGLGSAITTCQPVADWTACRRESAVPGSSWARTTSGDIDGTGARATGLLPVPGVWAQRTGWCSAGPAPGTMAGGRTEWKTLR